jgi:hypothetical protein
MAAAAQEEQTFKSNLQRVQLTKLNSEKMVIPQNSVRTGSGGDNEAEDKLIEYSIDAADDGDFKICQHSVRNPLGAARSAVI